MADNFDWRTDDDGEWEGSRPYRGRLARRRRWILPLAIILTIIAAGGAIYWQVEKRIAAAEAAVSDEVRSSSRLISQANAEGDIELFRNLLSGSNLEWAGDLQELFSQGWLFDLRPYGLSAAPLAVDNVEVTLSPELNSAEVSALATYRSSSSIAPVTVRLRQTKVFRKGERWVWSPPREEFWSGDATVQERNLSVSYPVRDEKLVLRLGRDLDLLVAELCAEVAGLTCPDDLMLELVFSREPGAMLAISEQFAGQGLFGSRLIRSRQGGGVLQMTLPTPTLVGVPLDDGGYQALLKAYSTQLAIALVNRFVDEECCGTEARLRAAARDMLADVGLDPWFGLDIDNTVAQADQPAQGQVALLCSDGFQRQQRLFLSDLSQMTWQEQDMTPELLAIKAMPGGDGVLLLGQVAGDRNTRSQIWHYSTQGANLLFDLPVSNDQAEQISWELQEQQALLVVEVPDLYRGYSSYFTLDLARCGYGECPTLPQSTASRPVWSPDGSQMMVRAYGLLWWRIGTSMVPIADGSAPFWVDEDHYGYVRTFGQEQAVALVQAGHEESEQVMLTTSRLRDALDFPVDTQDLLTRSDRLMIGRVIPIPPAGTGERESHWLILAFEIGRDGAVNQARFFDFDLDSGEVRLIEHAGHLLSYNLAPSGDRLALGGFVEESGRWAITVVGRDMAESTTIMLEAGGAAAATPSYSWSPDESWLLILDQGVLTLFQPGSGVIQRAVPPEASCVQAAWYGQSGSP